MLARLSRVGAFWPGMRGNKNVRPTKTEGASGTAIYGGYLDVDELSPDLSSPEQRAKTYSDILLNTSIVAASVAYFVDLVGNATWGLTPAEADTSEEWAMRADELLFSDPITPWRRIMRRASMYAFWGFSIAEWTMRKREEGWLTYHDIAPRAQRTIEYWNVTPAGEVEDIYQRSPQDQTYIRIPRAKLLYLVDDTLNDSPEGLGMFRLMVQSAQRLKQLERLQGFGYEMDMRGVVKLFAPQTELAAAEQAGTLPKGMGAKLLEPMRKLARGFVAGKLRSIQLDSAVYESQDQAGRPSSVRKWDAEIMSSSMTAADSMLRAIEWYERSLARIVGTDGLLLGGDGKGSYALSKDKTSTLRLRLEGTLEEERAQAQRDLLLQAWVRNGWPKQMMPRLTVTAPRTPDGAEIGATIREMAEALVKVDGMTVMEDEELEPAARKIVAVIEQVDAALASGERGTA